MANSGVGFFPLANLSDSGDIRDIAIDRKPGTFPNTCLLMGEQSTQNQFDMPNMILQRSKCVPLDWKPAANYMLAQKMNDAEMVLCISILCCFAPVRVWNYGSCRAQDASIHLDCGQFHTTIHELQKSWIPFAHPGGRPFPSNFVCGKFIFSADILVYLHVAEKLFGQTITGHRFNTRCGKPGCCMIFVANCWLQRALDTAALVGELHPNHWVLPRFIVW